jgi:N-acetylmuramic acid 6-phosphate (MurNAc-6-P) etherase
MLTGVTEDEAERLVAAADGELKTAVVAKQRNVSPAEARKLLAAADGHLRRAIGGDGDGDR